MGIFKKDIRKILPPPVQARHGLYSMVFSLDDDVSRPSDYLVSLALEAAGRAREVDLEDVCRRMKKPPFYPEVWPGEHYKFLAGLVLALKPRGVVEIGTSMGLSALAMKKYLPPESRISTFDVRDWRSHPDYALQEGDFADGRLVQLLGDLSDPGVCARHREILEEADLIFMDAEKDGAGERGFLENLGRVDFRGKVLLVLDDIRLWNMLKIWREISRPKLDVTSFGHWSGTGIVEWK